MLISQQAVSAADDQSPFANLFIQKDPADSVCSIATGPGFRVLLTSTNCVVRWHGLASAGHERLRESACHCDGGCGRTGRRSGAVCG